MNNLVAIARRHGYGSGGGKGGKGGDGCILVYTASRPPSPEPTPSPGGQVKWSNGTDNEIAWAIDAAQNGDIDLQQDLGWAVGDVRTIQLNPFESQSNPHWQEVSLVITSFDEYRSCGNVMQFDFLNSLDEGFCMNATNTAAGGYGASDMKNIIIPQIVAALPSYIKSRLKSFDVLCNRATENVENFTVTGNKLALRSQSEVLGASLVAQSEVLDGVPIPYYVNSVSNRIKAFGNSARIEPWWLRGSLGNTSFNFTPENGGEAGRSPFTNPTYFRGTSLFGCL